MDAGNINRRLIQDLQLNQSQVLQALTKVLGAKLGDQLIARVKEINTVPAEARAQLTEQLKNQLAQINTSSEAPAVKALSKQLMTQLAMLESAQLRLAQVSIKGQVLLTYTDQPLNAGQLLLLKLDASQRLVIQGAIGNSDLDLQQLEQLLVSADKTKDLAQLAKILRLTPLLNANAAARAITPENHQILSQALAALLPGKDSRPDVLRSLAPILQKILQLPASERQAWLSSQLQQALAKVAQQWRQPAQLSQARELARALGKSGVFFENQLAKLSATSTQEGTKQEVASAQLEKSQSPQPYGKASSKVDLPSTAALKLTGNVKESALLKGVSGGLNPGKDRLSATKADPRQDLKGALLGLLQQVDSELESSAVNTTNNNSKLQQTYGIAPSPGLDPNTDLSKLLPQIKPGTPELSMKALRQQLMMLIQQHTQGSLAKIQLQQLHALNHLADQAESGGQVTHSWQMELPVRIGPEVHPLQLHFQSQWVQEAEEQEGKADKPGQRVRQWQVMLNFDLPQLGHFYAQLIILGENLSANFWAEHNSTLEKARQRLAQLQAQLEKEGVHIKQLQCLPGTPLQPKMSLGYSLVDIQT